MITETARAQRLSQLSEIRDRQPSGEFAVRRHRFDDFNPYWQAGWPVPDSVMEAFVVTGKDQLFVIVDTGTDQPVIYATQEIIDGIYQNYQDTGQLSLYRH